MSGSVWPSMNSKLALYFRGDLGDFVKATQRFTPQDVIAGSTPEEREQIREQINIIDSYTDQLIAKI